MKPSYVVYECENCGGLFYRDVVETIVDDGADCHVKVQVLKDAEGADARRLFLKPRIFTDDKRIIHSYLSVLSVKIRGFQ